MENLKIVQLEKLVSLDKEAHELKRLAQFLLNAIGDWPDNSIVYVKDFLVACEEYFGSPLSPEKIQTVAFDGQNAWHLEAGKSLISMMLQAGKSLKINDASLVIEKISKYYCSELSSLDFQATVRMFSSSEGGIKTFIPNGYKPFIKFEGHDKITSAQFTLNDVDVLFAGQQAEIKIKLSDSSAFEKYLFSGLEFEIRNANAAIGSGEIRSVLNVDLEKDNWTKSFSKSNIFMVL
jgi:hypothetical protein